MNFIDRFFYKRYKKIQNSLVPDEYNPILSFEELQKIFSFQKKDSDISEITYFTCLKILSESLGKLSIHLKDRNENKVLNHDALDILKIRPNEYMTPSVFKQLLEMRRNHYGNSYAYIKYGKTGKLEGIYPLNSDCVKILIDDGNIFDCDMKYKYIDPKSKQTFLFDSKEILHFKGGFCKNGLSGMSIREVLASNMKSNKESQEVLAKLYESGMTANAVIKYTGDLSEKNKEKLLTSLKRATKGEGANRFIPLPLGMDITPLNLKLTDSQFYELKKYSALQIAAAFGLKPNHLNDYEKSSYANSEMQNLTFYVDTLLYILTSYEEELNYKLLTKEEIKEGYHFEFNIATILRGDIKTQAESLNRYVTGSIYTINEARKKASLPPVEGGNVIVVNGSYVSLKDLGTAYTNERG